jgi:hypothetical protein
MGYRDTAVTATKEEYRIARIGADLVIRTLMGSDGFRVWWDAMSNDERRSVESALTRDLEDLYKGRDFT